MHGQFAWHELTTSDPAAAQKFYKTFTGWGSQPFDADYSLLTSGGVPVAGVFQLTDEMRSHGIPPNWMPYVEANNVADTAKLAESLGARIMYGPTTIPNVGDIAVIQDPQGAVFGIYKSTSGAQSWDGTPVVGKFSWNELMSTDHAKAFDFYRRLFGWERINEMDMGDGQMYLLFGKGGAMYGGMFTRFGDMAQMHPFWLCYIHVRDVPKSLATATKSGAIVHRPPMEVPGGVIAILGDPQGAGFALHHQSVSASVSGKTLATAKKSKAVAKSSGRKKKGAKKPVAKSSGRKKKGAKKSVAKSSRVKVKKAAAKGGKKKSASRRPARRAKKK